MIKKIALILVLCTSALTWAGAPGDQSKLVDEVQKFIDNYTDTYVNLYAISSEAEWVANTVILDGVDSIGHMANLASEAYAKHVGSVEIMETHSFVDLPIGMPKEVFRDLKRVRVCGQKLNISRLDPKKSRKKKSGKKKSRKKKSAKMRHD